MPSSVAPGAARASTNCAPIACVTGLAAAPNVGKQPRSPATRAVVGCKRPMLAADCGNAVIGIA